MSRAKLVLRFSVELAQANNLPGRGLLVGNVEPLGEDGDVAMDEEMDVVRVDKGVDDDDDEDAVDDQVGDTGSRCSQVTPEKPDRQTHRLSDPQKPPFMQLTAPQTMPAKK